MFWGPRAEKLRQGPEQMALTRVSEQRAVPCYPGQLGEMGAVALLQVNQKGQWRRQELLSRESDQSKLHSTRFSY